MSYNDNTPQDYWDSPDQIIEMRLSHLNINYAIYFTAGFAAGALFLAAVGYGLYRFFV